MGMTSNKDIHERVDYVSEGYGVRDSSVKSSPSPCNHLIVVGQFVTLSFTLTSSRGSPCPAFPTKPATPHTIFKISCNRGLWDTQGMGAYEG